MYSSFSNSILIDSIVKWLKGLPKEDRVLFVRRYWYGDSLEVLAGKTTPNKLAGKLFRLRQKLKMELEREGIWI